MEKILLTEHFKEMELTRTKFDTEKNEMMEKIKMLTLECNKVNNKMN